MTKPRKTRAKPVPAATPAINWVPGQHAPANDVNSDKGAPTLTHKDRQQPERNANDGEQNNQNTGWNGEGDVAPVAETAEYAVAVATLPLLAHARPGETRGMCWERLRKEARAVGLAKGQGPGTAYEWATRETERLFPPPEPEPVEPEPEPSPEPELAEEPAPQQPVADHADQEVPGLGDLPADWPQLPDNAPLQVEISWVSANRLRVRNGAGVDLSKASRPAPSYSALSWLETSILFPSKFADISVKATANQSDEQENVRREKLAIDEIRALLAEMLEPPC